MTLTILICSECLIPFIFLTQTIFYFISFFLFPLDWISSVKYFHLVLIPMNFYLLGIVFIWSFNFITYFYNDFVSCHFQFYFYFSRHVFSFVFSSSTFFFMFFVIIFLIFIYNIFVFYFFISQWKTRWINLKELLQVKSKTRLLYTHVYTYLYKRKHSKWSCYELCHIHICRYLYLYCISKRKQQNNREIY